MNSVMNIIFQEFVSRLKTKHICALLLICLAVLMCILFVRFEVADDNNKKENGHYYRVFEESVNWNIARKMCEDNGGHLATITSDREQQIIKRMSGYDAYWIGGIDEYGTGDWKWVTGEEFSDKYWSKGEPNDINDKENVLVVYLDGTFNDANSFMPFSNREEGLPYICEWEHKVNIGIGHEKIGYVWVIRLG